jgi:hypothetical protein
LTRIDELIALRALVADLNERAGAYGCAPASPIWATIARFQREVSELSAE